jgi:hypothetical protein
MLLSLYTGPQPGGDWCNAPTTNLDAPTSNLQNTKPKQADQPDTTPATPYRIHMLRLLNRSGWTELMFRNVCICRCFV